MSVRRFVTVLLLILASMPASGALAGSSPQLPHQEISAASRADVLAGRATEEQALELLKTSVESAGGVTIPAAPTQEDAESQAMGGHAFPILAIDLNGDGDDESLLVQYTDRQHLVAIDDGEILWRYPHPDDAQFVGVLPANLWEGPGEEAVLVMLQWTGEDSPTALLEAVGGDGSRWGYGTEVDWFELNGVVQADTDPEDEIALTAWKETLPLSVRVIDGLGGQIGALTPTLEEGTGRSLDSQAFVTDGAGNAPDEAVFVTPLLAGYYAERLSLADGAQTALDVKVNAEVRDLHQGPDYTGDGRRDAFIAEYIGGPLDFTATYGVFDGTSFTTAWTETSQEEFFYFDPPYRPGDTNGDGGQDLCFDDPVLVWDNDSETVTTTVRCLSGATGAELWKASHEVTGQYAYSYVLTWSDLDANGVIDPIVLAETWSCSDDGEDPCVTTSFEARALNGLNGSVLWSTQDVDQDELGWGFSDANLDGVAGDDAFVSSETDSPDAFINVVNGSSLQGSWAGVIDTGEIPGFANSAMDADLDGDGSTEAVITASAYEETGEIICYDPEGNFCFPEYDEYAYVAAFDASGERLWELAL